VRTGEFATRGVVLAFLGALAVARAFDAVNHGGPGYLLFLAALFVLPVWVASGTARDRWRWWFLLVQAVLTYVPFAVFGSGWVGGMSGLLAGLVLLTVSAPWSWLVFCGLVVVEEGLWLAVGLPYEPALNSTIWVLIAFADVGLALFGLTRLAEVVGEVRATRDEVTVAAVARQRLAIADRLRSAIDARLEVVEAHATAALRSLATSPSSARREMAAAGKTAREVVTEARELTGDDDPPPPHRGVALAPRLAGTVLLLEVVLFSLQNLLNFVAPTNGPPYSWFAILVAVLVGVATTVLQLRHSGLRHGGGRPPGWRWTFALQVVLAYVLLPFAHGFGTLYLTFLAGTALLLFRGWPRWVLFGAVLASQTVLGVVFLSELPPAILVRWIGYTTAIMTAYGLVVYGLSRLAGLAVRLAGLRAELAELAATRERLRLARDTHDLLGLGLSTVALKTDLVDALIGRDDDRARHELGELLRICVTARTDVRRIVGASLQLTFDTELRLARDILTSSGIAVRLPDPEARAPSHVDAVLATVVREAVTNILRHSRAGRCSIVLTTSDGVRLTIRNDGVATSPGLSPPDVPGKGLANLGARVSSAAGHFTTHRTGTEFEVSAEFPAQASR
jgi:two-component system sensor histidine kinase DesK